MADGREDHARGRSFILVCGSRRRASSYRGSSQYRQSRTAALSRLCPRLKLRGTFDVVGPVARVVTTQLSELHRRVVDDLARDREACTGLA